MSGKDWTKCIIFLDNFLQKIPEIVLKNGEGYDKLYVSAERAISAKARRFARRAERGVEPR